MAYLECEVCGFAIGDPDLERIQPRFDTHECPRRSVDV